MKGYLRLSIFFFFCFISSGIVAQDTTQMIVPGRKNDISQQQKPYVIYISIDGLGHDIAKKFDAAFLNKKRNDGVQATSMKPSFPSLTFPNHYTLATGLYPAHHGIVGNSFRAGKNAEFSYSTRNREAVANPGFYGGIPLWVLAEKHRMLSAAFYWVGSEAPVDSTFASYYYNYNEDIPVDRRIEIVKEWLQLPPDRRPHLIMFYMPEVDHQIHGYGIESDSVRAAVQLVDYTIRRMNEMTDSLGLPVNYVLVSDHGMADVDTLHPITVPTGLDTSKFKMSYNSTFIQLYARDKKDVKETYRRLKKEAANYSVYLKNNTPARWHYRAKDDWYNRVGDIIMVADEGKAFNFFGRRTLPGDHGYDNNSDLMKATFYAWGPAFKEKLVIPSFENIHVYPMIAHLLGLDLICQVDGKLEVLQGILK